jgi:hypothetical protein
MRSSVLLQLEAGQMPAIRRHDLLQQRQLYQRNLLWCEITAPLHRARAQFASELFQAIFLTHDVVVREDFITPFLNFSIGPRVNYSQAELTVHIAPGPVYDHNDGNWFQVSIPYAGLPGHSLGAKAGLPGHSFGATAGRFRRRRQLPRDITPRQIWERAARYFQACSRAAVFDRAA